MTSSMLLVTLIVAAVLIAVVIQLIMRGWRHRGRRQAALIGELPAVPETVGSAIIAPTRGGYAGCILARSWHDRVHVGDLGHRGKAVLTRYPEGILVQRSKAGPIWIPQESITAIGTERGMLAIRWRLPTGAEICTGFRCEDRTAYDRWLATAGDAAESGGTPALRADDEEERRI